MNLQRLKQGLKTAAIWIGCILAGALYFCLLGMALDYFAILQSIPDWQYVTTWDLLLEKLFVSLGLGYMLGIIPTLVLAFIGAVIVMSIREHLQQAEVTSEYLINHFDQADGDQDGVVSWNDLLFLYLNDKYVAGKFLSFWQQYGNEVSVGYPRRSIYALHLCTLEEHPALVRKKTLKTIGWTAYWILLPLSAVLTWHWYGVAFVAAVVSLCLVFAYRNRIQEKVRLKRFLLRHFARLDANGDDVVNERDLAALMSELAPSERAVLVDSLHRLGDIGHRISAGEALPEMRAVSRVDLETAVPALAEALAV